MALIGVLVSFVPLTTIKSADVNTNFSAIQTAFNNSAVLTDVAKTIGVTHTWTAAQTFTAGITTGATSVFGAGIIFGTDNAFNVGSVSANRPANVYVANAVQAGGAVYGAQFIQQGTASGTGVVRLANAAAISWRNAANTADLVGVAIDATNTLSLFGGAMLVGGTAAAVPAGYFTVGAYAGTAKTTGDIVARRSSTTGVYYFGDGASNYLFFDGTGYELGAYGTGASLSLGGHLLMGLDNTYDIGASGATRPRNMFLANAIVMGGQLYNSGGIQVTGTGTFGSGAGLELAGGASPNLTAFNRSTSAYLPMQANALSHTFLVSGTTTFQVTNVSAGFGAPILFFADNTYDIGSASASRPRNIYAAGTIFSASSRDLKQDVRPSHVDALSIVRKTRIVDYRYKASPEVASIGFIAEETDELLSGRSRQEFNLNNAVGLLLKAVQELETKVGKVERRLQWAA